MGGWERIWALQQSCEYAQWQSRCRPSAAYWSADVDDSCHSDDCSTASGCWCKDPHWSLSWLQETLPSDRSLDSPVALWSTLLLILQCLKQAAPVQDGRVDTHVVHEGEGGVEAHVGLVHPVPPPPLLPLPFLLPSILPRCSLCQVEPLYGQRPVHKNTWGQENWEGEWFQVSVNITWTSPPSWEQKTFLASSHRSAGWTMMCTARLCWSAWEKGF